LRDQASLESVFAKDLAGRFETPPDERGDVDELAPAAHDYADKLVDPDLGSCGRLLRNNLTPFVAVAELDPLFLEGKPLAGEVPFGFGHGFPRNIGDRYDFSFLDYPGGQDGARKKDD
jgi:hypothetical protein